MKYRERTTGEVYQLFELQQKFSNVSFPPTWDETTYDFANVDLIITIPEPSAQCNTRYDYTGLQYINNQWTDTWSEVPKFNDAAEQAICEADCLEGQWGNVRYERNTLLAVCDWTQLIDCPLNAEQKSAWSAYRQELRNVPQTQTDPLNIIWPSTP